MEMTMEKQSEAWRARVRRLNDQFRSYGIGRGSLMVTAGIHERGEAFVQVVLAMVRSFATFDTSNDPHHEHDFGAFTLGGERVFFKVDYYDLVLEGHSPDAADPAQTHRVLTVMLASEY
jgi:hypothetical protein